MIGFPKPEPRQRTKARAKRQEATVKTSVRERVEERDGYCRLAGVARFGPCGGRSHWCHLWDRKQARTRGMDPEVRHTTEDSIKLCQLHHLDGAFAEERGRMTITPLDAEKRADGRLRYEAPGLAYYVEPV